MPGITLGDVLHRLDLTADCNGDGRLTAADVNLRARVATAFQEVAGDNGLLDEREVDAFIGRLSPLLKAGASKQRAIKSALQAPASGGIPRTAFASVGGGLGKQDVVVADPMTTHAARQADRAGGPVRAPDGENVVAGPFDFHKYVNPLGSPGFDTGLACYGFKSLSDEHFEYGMKTLYLELMAQLSPFGEIIKTVHELHEGKDLGGGVGATSLMVELMEHALGGDAKLTAQEADMLARCAKSLTRSEKLALLSYARGTTTTVPESLTAKLPKEILKRFASVESLENGLQWGAKFLKVVSFVISAHYIHENNQRGPTLALAAEEITARLMTRYYGPGGTSQGNISTYAYVKTSRHTPEEFTAIANRLYAQVKRELEGNLNVLSSKHEFYSYARTYYPKERGYDANSLDAWLRDMQSKYHGVIVEHETSTSSKH